MKKILVVSDTHREDELFARIIKKNKDCDYFIHCGDSSLPFNDPLLQGFITVLGNHDEDPNFDKERFLSIEKQRILITHGHLYHVYDGYDALIEKAKKMKCTLVLHGHTHIPTHQIKEGIHFINPGSVLFNRGSYGFGTYAILKIDQDQVTVHFFNHETDEIVDSIVLEDGLKWLEYFKNNK